MTITKISRYIVKGQLGQGGMGTVFQGYDPSFERDVAIKVLPESLLFDPQFRTRFQREAKAIARLEHPTIVPVYDVGEENNQPYIVMRYMSGGSLADRVKNSAISLEETAQIMFRLAPALDAAHKQGIIHRDLKPGNILFDQYGNAFLSDFGIARMGQAEGPSLTGNFILGTPAYMSPEQARGEPDLDGRSDIYSLGATVFEMLSGRVPFEADTPMAQALKQIMEPTPNILELRPDLPLGVQDVITKSMEKDRLRRFSTAEEMSLALTATVKTKGTVIAKPAGSEPTVNAVPAAVAATVFASPQVQPTVIPTGKKGGAAQAVTTAGAVPAGASTIPGAPAAYPEGAAAPPAKKGGGFLLWGIIGAVVIGLLAVGAIFILPRLNSPAPATPTSQALVPPVEEAATATATTAPTVAPTDAPTEAVLATEEATLEPTTELATATPEAAVGGVLGGSDRVAYLIDRNIMTANVDGSQEEKITVDSTEKISLQWHPDGKSIYYISGKCLFSIEVATKAITEVTCFKTAKQFDDFEISRDGSKIAFSLNNQMFIVPLDLEKLKTATKPSALTAMSECQQLAPYTPNFIKEIQWSTDGTFVAAKVLGVLDTGQRGEIIQLIRVDECVAKPGIIHTFYPNRMNIPEYNKTLTLQKWTFDGTGLIVFTTFVRNEVYGDMYEYNTEIGQGTKVNPVRGACCYTDPTWSPDGSYLFFTFQDRGQGSASENLMYYVPWNTIEAGGTFEPTYFPPVTDQRVSPNSTLKPAQ